MFMSMDINVREIVANIGEIVINVGDNDRLYSSLAAHNTRYFVTSMFFGVGTMDISSI